MQQFRIRSDSFNETNRKALVKLILLFCIIAVGVSTVQFVNNEDTINNIYVLSITVIIVVALFFGVLVYMIPKIRKKNDELLGSYVLTFDGFHITREMRGFPFISISKDDVVEIVKSGDGSFVIKGKTDHDLIGVPCQIEEYDTVERLLSETKPISVKPGKSFKELLHWAMIPLIVITMLLVYGAENKIIVLISGSLFLIISAYNVYQTKTSKNIPSLSKKSLWIFGMVIISVMGVMYIKLIIK